MSARRDDSSSRASGSVGTRAGCRRRWAGTATDVRATLFQRFVRAADHVAADASDTEPAGERFT